MTRIRRSDRRHSPPPWSPVDLRGRCSKPQRQKRRTRCWRSAFRQNRVSLFSSTSHSIARLNSISTTLLKKPIAVFMQTQQRGTQTRNVTSLFRISFHLNCLRACVLCVSWTTPNCTSILNGRFTASERRSLSSVPPAKSLSPLPCALP